MGQTFAEKALARKAGLDTVKPGQIITVKPDKLLTHDNTADISRKFYRIGVERVADPGMNVIVLDHVAPAANETYAANHQLIREFVTAQEIPAFYDVGEGICHQLLPEKGHAWPGALIVGSDSHTTTHGAWGAFAAGIGRTEAASVMATGEIWLRVPESIKIIMRGKLPPRVAPKDVILHIIGDLRADGATYCSVEFTGEIIDRMSIAGRMTLTNMAAELGAKNAVVIPDEKTLAWLAERVAGSSIEALRRQSAQITPDPDAQYARIVEYELSALVPQIAKPHTVDNVVPLTAVAGTQVDQCLIGTCTNGRLEDLRAAAELLRGQQIASTVRLLILPASRSVLLSALEAGLVSELVEAGATLLNPGCGPCLGAHEGAMAPGEVTLSTANRNFKGRMGSNEAFIYLGSPATVAASALTGVITDPRDI